MVATELPVRFSPANLHWEQKAGADSLKARVHLALPVKFQEL